MKIRIHWSTGEAVGILNNSPTAKSVYGALPVSTSANTWGEEVYFDLPVEAQLAPDAQQVVEPGTICYWVQGSSLALPYGPTPVSETNECRLITAVNVLGRLEGDPRVLATIASGDRITVEVVEV